MRFSVFCLTKKTGYGLIGMSYLARLHGGRVVSAREIADRFGVPAALLMNVLKELASAGFVESVRGAHGGYRLARAPAEISLADLVVALEGPIRFAECIRDGPGDEEDDGICRLVGRCPIADPVHRVHRRLHDFLKQVTLAEIAQSAGAIAEG